MLAYQLYKGYKQKQQDRSNAGYERKTSTESDTTPLNTMDLEEGGAPKQGIKREGTISEAQMSKKAARKAWMALTITLLIEVILPVALYYILKSHMSMLAALLISSAPAILSVFVKAIWYRRVDPLGVLIVGGFIISAAISVIDANPRVLLLRESCTTAAMGLFFFLSLIPIKIGKWQLKPLSYSVSYQMAAAAPSVRFMRNGEMVEMKRPEFNWQYIKVFRKIMRINTVLWGIALLSEFTGKLIMYFSSLTIDQMVLYGNIVLGSVMVTTTIISVVLSMRMRKLMIPEVEKVKRQLEVDAQEYLAKNQAYQTPYDPQPPIQADDYSRPQPPFAGAPGYQKPQSPYHSPPSYPRQQSPYERPVSPYDRPVSPYQNLPAPRPVSYHAPPAPEHHGEPQPYDPTYQPGQIA
ncbi:hypothetical protein INT43_008269 [Umbelopsis isabellina]|uniref:Uncharacterized protein n=1 Tax=Mortierella isabellina TaxID=91625 RepID=A0A8H7PCX1_MORIS|nr:hypothetical protein INT43_008269 [Umbelopsis isabellina]